MSVVWMLSLSAIGMPCSGPRTLPLRALAVARVGFLERVRVHRDDRVQLVLVGRDAREVLLHDLARGDALLLHRRLHFRDRRFDHAERLACGRQPGPPSLGDQQDPCGSQNQKRDDRSTQGDPSRGEMLTRADRFRADDVHILVVEQKHHHGGHGSDPR